MIYKGYVDWDLVVGDRRWDWSRREGTGVRGAEHLTGWPEGPGNTVGLHQLLGCDR